jgi:AraC-like DNA-binding protein
MQNTVIRYLTQYNKAGELAAHIRSCCRNCAWEGLQIETLCKRFASSETVLTRAFRQRFGATIHAFIIQEKMTLAKSMLTQNILPVKEIAYLLGYSELSNFSRDFSRCFRVSPNLYRQSVGSCGDRHLSSLLHHEFCGC